MLPGLIRAAVYLSGLMAFNVVAIPDEELAQSFFPYLQPLPIEDAPAVGTRLNRDNADKYKRFLDPAIFQAVKTGEYEITVGETISFDQHPVYIEATQKHAAAVNLPEEMGVLEGFVAGRPFPQEPLSDDPRAGERLAWNFRYAYRWGDAGAILPSYWQYRDYRSGKVERTLKMTAHLLNFKHRVNFTPKPELPGNPADILHAGYSVVQEPFDLKNTQLLIQRYADDRKRDSAYLYLGFQRRVRRLSSGQTTDAYLGSDLMIEDFGGYNGRIIDMKWQYRGTEYLLMPLFKHNEMALDSELHQSDDGFQVISFTGQGKCYPNISWQLRKMYLLESQPVDDDHPVGKRLHYIDAQTFSMPRTLVYDRKGDLWKSLVVAVSHPDYHLLQNKGSYTPIDDGFGMIDLQAEHCTTGQFRSVIGAELSPQKLFSVQNMRAAGR